MTNTNTKINTLSKEWKEFIKHFAFFLTDWTKEVKEVMIAHIEETYNNEAVKYLLKKYYDECQSELASLERTIDLIAGGCDQLLIDNSSTTNTHWALYDVCYKRFTK